MEAGAIPHDARRQDPALDELGGDEHARRERGDQQASVRLGPGERHRGDEPDRGPEVGDDGQEAEEEADQEAVVEPDEGESDRHQQALQEGDRELGAEEHHEDVHELAAEPERRVAGLRLQEGQEARRIGGGRLPEQEEAEVKRDDGPAEEAEDSLHDPGAGREDPLAEQGGALDQRRPLADEEVADLPAHRVVLEEVHDQRGLGEDEAVRRRDRLGRLADKVPDLAREQVPEGQREGREKAGDRREDRGEGEDRRQPQALLEAAEPRPEDERGERPHGERQQDVRERGQEPVERPRDPGGGRDEDREGEDGERRFPDRPPPVVHQ